MMYIIRIYYSVKYKILLSKFGNKCRHDMGQDFYANMNEYVIFKRTNILLR